MNGYEYCTSPLRQGIHSHEDDAKLVRQKQQRGNAAQTR